MTYREALVAARSHVAEVPLDHPDYRVGFAPPRAIAEGWYFDFVIEPVRAVAEAERESFAGSPGFIVPSDGARPREVSWAEFQERRLWEAPPAS